MEVSSPVRLQAASPGSGRSISSNGLVNQKNAGNVLPVLRMEENPEPGIPSEIFKKFSAPNHVISEPAMAEGFCWQPKQPARPGQFSERPRTKTTDVPLIPKDVPAETPYSHRGQVDAKVRPRGIQQGPELQPLELPEFNFELLKENEHR
ncbi:hypothetical protein GMORB2_0872 [Geosmithia morbida]|uniref:Uncharacterized protein n=1 Tax=Geosmithia morbida TaxID=1094350 RepID=A0A9P5D2Z3_9HYPO|nr:uncharacterized protein GMORB2_0872 [Geosmithia morbida]KAF4125628.1 hypothetical protein GMORB2_0872 [Geosmithia morbida]